MSSRASTTWSRLAAFLALAALAAGCKDEPSSLETAKSEAAAKPGEAAKNVTIVKTPVPYGAKIACEKLFPDLAALGAALGREVTLEDNSQSDQEAASVCRFKLAGKPPSEKEQAKMFQKNNMVMGVLPGDELCQVTAYCAFIYDKAELRAKCEKEGKTVSEEVGELTCVRTVQAGPNDRYLYEVLDPDSRCKLLVNPGPSVVDEATVKTCAKAAVDLIGPAQIKTP